MTSPSRSIRLGRIIILVALVVPPLGLAWPARPASAASSVQALVAQAEHNTNTVRTLVHHDRRIITSVNGKVTVNDRGAEDEVHNRERDYESVTVRAKIGKKVQRLHYTADIIFMKGRTYYRISLAKNKWQTRKGMTFADPYAGGWKRGRTTVSFLKGFNFQRVGVAGGKTHVRSTFSKSGAAGSVDLWITGGAKPYVVRVVYRYHLIKQRASSFYMNETLGPFNGPVVVLPPINGTST